MNVVPMQTFHFAFIVLIFGFQFNATFANNKQTQSIRPQINVVVPTNADCTGNLASAPQAAEETSKVDNSHHTAYVDEKNLGIYQLPDYGYIFLKNILIAYKKQGQPEELKNKIKDVLKNYYIDLFYLYDTNTTLFQLVAQADQSAEMFYLFYSRIHRNPQVRVPQIIFDFVRADLPIHDKVWDALFDVSALQLSDLLVPATYRRANFDINKRPHPSKINQMIRAALRSQRHLPFLIEFLSRYNIKGYLELNSPTPDLLENDRPVEMKYAKNGKKDLAADIKALKDPDLLKAYNEIPD